MITRKTFWHRLRRPIHTPFESTEVLARRLVQSLMTAARRLRVRAGGARLLSRAGRLPEGFKPSRRQLLSQLGMGGVSGLDALEGRVFLAGDHPSFALPLTAGSGDFIALNGAGEGTATGVIETAGQDDLFRIEPAATDFIRVLIDTPTGSLNSAVEIYDLAGTLIRASSDNGMLSSGLANDGWAGFVGTGGQPYFIRVLGEGIGTGTGAYTVRVDATSVVVPLVVDEMDPALGQPTMPPIAGNIASLQDDEVYRVVAGATTIWNSLAFAVAAADDFADLDTHLDVYNAQGVRLVSDIQGGRLTDAFATWLSTANAEFFIRVRSDELSAARASTGAFTLVLDLSATAVDVELVTRLGPADLVSGLNSGQEASSFTFVAQGSGLTFVTVQGVPLPPLPDPSVRIYDANGVQIGFSDDFNGTTAQLEIQLIGGRRYFLVVEGFDAADGGNFAVFIESHHTFIDLVIDDHIDGPPQAGLNLFATPLIFNAPFLNTDADGNDIRDRSWRQSAFGTGRLHVAGESDLFMFTPPVDMLSNYDGNDGNEGTALYIGGTFTMPDGLVNAENLTVWDASDYWPAGPGTVDLGGIDGTIRAMVVWDFDGNTATPPALVVGGDFTMEGAANGPAENLAVYAFSAQQNRYLWFAFTPVNGPVNAFTIIDAEFLGEITGDTAVPALVLGGEFTDVGGTPVRNLAHIFLNPLTGAFQTVSTGGGTNGRVNALAVWDQDDLGDPDEAGPMVDPPDQGPQLVVGGAFTQTGVPGVARNRIAMFGITNDGDEETVDLAAWKQLGTGANNGVNNGEVFAIQVIDPVDVTEGVDELVRIVVGGSFTQAGGAAAARIATFVNDADAATNATQTGDWSQLDTGANGTVFALTLWFPPDNGGSTGDIPLLIAGGAFTDAGNRVAAHVVSAGTWIDLAGGIDDGEVRTLTAFEDNEFGTSTFQVLYAGGTFTMAGGEETQHIAKFDLDPLGNFAWLPLNNGLPDATDEVLALVPFDDHIGGRWDRNERPAGRLAINLAPTFGSFANMFVAVYDSNFNLVWTNETIAPPFPDPAGSDDPPSSDGEVLFAGIPIWGGEVYYIQVLGTNTGRYTLSVTVDALPPDDANALPPGTPGDGQFQDVISVLAEIPDAGQWAIAPEIPVGAANGDGSNISNAFQLTPNTYASANEDRTYEVDPAGLLRLQAGDFSTIEDILDTDLYAVTATRTGYIEVRINTTNLPDTYVEHIVDLSVNPPTVETLARVRNNGQQAATAPLQSLLDSALRIFNNDFEEISYNDDFPGIDGVLDVNFIGSFGDRVFQRRDARVVFPVIEGETYFIQVESGQAQRIDLTDPMNPDRSLVDWRFAIGGYELLIHGMSSLNFVDDHANSSVAPGQETPIPIVNDQNDPANGTGSATGVIADHPVFNPNDDDIFDYYAPANGTTTITVSAAPGSSVAPNVRIEDATGVVIAGGNGQAGGSVTINVPVTQGDRFFIVVDGGGGSQGAYIIDIDGAGVVDDHASTGNWPGATVLTTSTFFGTAIVEGTIETAADDDIFVYTATDYEFATVSVEALSDELDPLVLVYEVTADGAGNPVLVLIGFNDNQDAGTRNSRATFSVTPTRPYYVVVRGINGNIDFGDYRLTLQIAPTDDHPNFGESPATIVPIVFDSSNQTGVGTSSGVIEVDTDTDLFRFTAPATGDVTVTIATPDSGLAPRVRLFDSNGTQIDVAEGTMGGAIIIAAGAIEAGEQYFILVGPGTSSDGAEPDLFGSYTIQIDTSPVDDHPDEADFPTATTILLSAATGNGTATGFIVPVGDTDLFTFTSRAAGNIVITVTTPGSNLNPNIRVYLGSLASVIAGASDDADVAGQTVVASAANEVFYLIVESDGAASDQTGAYLVSVSGQTGGGTGGGGPDDYPDAGEFVIAAEIPLATTTADGSLSGVIEAIGDSDLFKFTAPATGTVFVQVVTPAGSTLDGGLRIFNASFTQISSNTAGLPGATAALSFAATGGQTYFALVNQIGSAIGSYRIRVDATPATHFLYYPEGYAASTIDEFVPLVNTNSFAVTYSVFARYENTALPPTLLQSSVTIPANSRGGFTISSRSNSSISSVVKDTPYALEIQSTGQLGASLSHYDFGQTTGEAFTSRTSTVWTFADVHRDPVRFRDFLVFFNPGAATATYTLELFYEDGSVTTFTRSLSGQRRGGVNFTTDSSVVRDGVFGVRLTSSQPLVAALTSFNILDTYGIGVLGNADGGSTEGVIPSMTHGDGVDASIHLFNPGATTASVTIRASYTSISLPDVVQTISVAAGSRRSVTLADLGIAADEQVGVRYTASGAITVSSTQVRNGDGDGTAAGTDAAQRFVFGDAFVNPAFAGTTYIESLGLYNPAGFGINVTITFRFEDGSAPATTVISLGADEFAFVSIDQQAAILARPGPTAFSIQVDAPSPIVAAFTHYDLFLNGGWTALGAPIGLTNALSTI